MDITIELTGTAPLLMHNPQLVDPFNKWTRAMKAITDKGSRNMTDADRMDLARLEFMGGLYWDPELGPYLPGANVEAALVGGARLTRHGTKVQRGLFVTEDRCMVRYDGPRDPDDLWADEAYRSALRVCVNRGSSTIRYRPQFPVGWQLVAPAVLDESTISFDVFSDIAVTSGLAMGLGDNRPRYGRFTATVTKN